MIMKMGYLYHQPSYFLDFLLHTELYRRDKQPITRYWPLVFLTTL